MRETIDGRCDPDMPAPETEVGLQAMLASEAWERGSMLGCHVNELRICRGLGYDFSVAERRDLARLYHAGLIDPETARRYLQEYYEAVVDLDHPELQEHSPAGADKPYEAFDRRVAVIADATGEDEREVSEFHRKLGTNPTGMEYCWLDDDEAEAIRAAIHGAFPCEMYTRGAVFGDFAVRLEATE